MCTITRLRESALRLAHCEGGLPQAFMGSEYYLRNRAARRLIEAAISLAPESAPVLRHLLAAETCHPSDYDGICAAYAEAEGAACDLTREYSERIDAREEDGEAA